MFLDVDILPLMDNKLKVNFHIRKFFHPLEGAFIHAFLVFFQEFLDWLVQYRFNMVNNMF